MKSKLGRRKINRYKKKSLLTKFKQQNGGDCVREGLNHPWSVYPRGVVGAYSFYERYQNETIRLIEFMKHLQTDENIYHLNFIIGSPLEDPFVRNDQSEYFKDIQWQQIIPYHIQQLLVDLNKNPRKQKLYIQIIVISPDDFINESYNPLFTTKGIYRGSVKKTGLLEWCIHYNKIKINFFNCPVPHIENRVSLKDITMDKSVESTYKISSYISNDIDIECVGLFYHLLRNLCEKQLSIAINSWAVFKVDPTNGFTFHTDIINYQMFPELLRIAKKYNLIATEWYWLNNDYNIIHDLVNDVYYTYIRPPHHVEFPRLILPVPQI